MSDRSFSSDLATWDEEDFEEFFRLLGLTLEAQMLEQRHADVSSAVYAVTEEIMRGTDADHVAMGDELRDNVISDVIWDHSGDSLIVMSWTEGRVGTAGSIRPVDLGTGKLFVMEPPDSDSETGWEVVSIVDPDEPAAFHDVVVDFLGRGWLPDSITIVPYIDPTLIKDVYRSTLNAGVFNDWAALKARMDNGGVESSIDTAEHRERTLDAYLDEVLHTDS